MGFLSILKRGTKKDAPSSELDEKRDVPDAISPSSSNSDFNSGHGSDPHGMYSSTSDFALDKYNPPSSRLSFRHDNSSYGFGLDESADGEGDDECLDLPSSPSSPRLTRPPKKRDATVMMADSIYRRACVWHQWFTPPSAGGAYGDVSTGIALRGKNGKHILYPHTCRGLQDFGWAISHLNPAVSSFASISPARVTDIDASSGCHEAQFLCCADHSVGFCVRTFNCP